MAIYQLGDHVPRLAAGAWVAEGADVIGNVELGEGASIWFGTVLRADNEPMIIGRRSNIQDGSVLHSDPGSPLIVGDDVTVGHQVMLHGCSIGDGSLVGIKAVILNGARIGKHCLVGAGSLVPEGKVYEDGWLIMGTPAKAVRQLTPEQLEGLKHGAEHYVENAQRFASTLKRIE